MKLFFSSNGTIEELEKGLQLFDSNLDIKSMLVLACDNNNFTPENCNPILKSIKKPLWGGVFPAIIHNNKKFDKGTLIIGLKKDVNITCIKNLSDNTAEYESCLENFIDDSNEFSTIAVLVDGFSKRISALIEALFLVYGLEYNYIGGGAGSLSMLQKPCIISNSGLFMDCAIIASIKMKSGIGVQHGWESFSGPYKITSSDKNTIKTIDFRPAFEVYKDIIQGHSGQQLTHKNFFEIAKAYPFGINKLGAEKVVRDPITVQNDYLVCVGEMPEGSFVDVLHGNVDSLVNAAKIAAQSSRSYLKSNKHNFDLFFDCISRVLFLGENFKDELNIVNISDRPLIGALSIGEIANNKKDYLEFYNKTAVVASFSE